MGTTLSKLFGNGSKKNNGAEPGAGQSATLPRATTSKVKVDVPKKSSSFRIPFPKKSKTPSPAVTPTIPPKNQENAPAPSPTPALNVIEVQIDEEAFKKSETKITESVAIVKTELESVIEDVKNEGEENVENAVVKIQAGVRGFLTRKHIKEGSSPDNELGECIDNDKRIETPTPSSPLKTTFSLLESIPQQEERPEVPLEELEILKKVQEINQLLAKDDDDEPFKVLESVQSKVEQSADTVINTVENVLTALDANIQQAEKEAPVVIESAFSDVLDKTESLFNETDVKEQQIQIEESEQGSVQQVPIHVTKSPSIEQEEDERKGLSEEEAAIRIQAAFRGYGVRKSLSREPSPGREKIEDEVKILAEETQAFLEQEVENVEEIQMEVEPIIEATVAKTEVEAANTETAAQNEPEIEAALIEEEVIVPVTLEHDEPEDVDQEKPEPVVDESTVISDDNKHEIEKLEALVSDDILSDVQEKAAEPSHPENAPESVEASSSDNVPEPIDEEPFTKSHVEPKEQTPNAPESENIVPETVPEIAPVEEIAEAKAVEETATEPEPTVPSEENKETAENTETQINIESPTFEKEETTTEKSEEQAENDENKKEAQTIENAIQSMEDNKDSLVMKIKIGVENDADDDHDNKKAEQDKNGDESEEDISTSAPVNRESSPAASGNKRKNRNKNKNRKR